MFDKIAEMRTSWAQTSFVIAKVATKVYTAGYQQQQQQKTSVIQTVESRKGYVYAV